MTEGGLERGVSILPTSVQQLPGLQVVLFTDGYPYVDCVMRAVDLARRHGGSFSRVIGEPFSLRRDQFVRRFLDSGGAHALFLEGDVVPPEDLLDRLLATPAPVVTAVYPRWLDGRMTSNVQAAADRGWSDNVPARVFAVRRCTLGCTLIRREVFERVEPPWFLATLAGDRFVDDEEWFCNAVRRTGMPILCDGSVMCSAVRQRTDLRSLPGGTLRRG
jgi:hypothetical protein